MRLRPFENPDSVVATNTRLHLLSRTSSHHAQAGPYGGLYSRLVRCYDFPVRGGGRCTRRGYLKGLDGSAMRWFRSNMRLGAWCALFALMTQLALSFAHVHLEDFGPRSAAAFSSR